MRRLSTFRRGGGLPRTPPFHQDLELLHLVWRMIPETAAAGTAVIAASHDPDGFPYADRILDLKDRKLLPGSF